MNDNEKIKCLVLGCNKLCKNLSTHIKIHNLTMDEYRKQYDFYGKCIVYSKETLEKVRLGRVGKKHSNEAKMKMSLAHLGIKPSEESRQKMSVSKKGIKRSDETKIKISIGHKGKHLSEEHKKSISFNLTGFKHPFFNTRRSELTKKRISLGNAKAYLNGKRKHKNNHITGFYYSLKMNKKIFYRSNYEKIVMQYLDKHPLITEWHYEPFIIPYINEYGLERNYIPDFLVVIDCHIKEIWEVKSNYVIKDHDKGSCNFGSKMNALENFVNENKFDGFNIISDDEIKIIKHINWKEIYEQYGEEYDKTIL